MLDHQIDKSSSNKSSSVSAQVDVKEDDPQPQFFTRYVQIKRQVLMVDDQNMQVMQIIDISKDIMYSIANGEKKLMALINATVSHEMRNPLNSIQSQLIK